ncbi:LacI family DNA-binding transcriptional regulator [Opitutus sp. ER46]|uniref:LacI family DNA-binding transcriptional regulator n=1 Tax=Opitutus sp. ER46 TaxID=2161864 RepID=UPI001304EF89|nr:LacI family DNA-binding transcriptional regulator [Opitutus sp. ER46]
MPTPVTLQQLADRLKLSRAAVSFALRNQPGVSDAVRQRVQALAKTLGYRMNPLVAAHMAHIRSGRTPRYRATVAFVLFWRPDRSDKLHQLYRSGMETRAQELGYRIEEFVVGPELSVARLAAILRSRGINGAVIGPLLAPGAFAEFAWEKFATVTIGYSLREPETHRASFDHFGGMGKLLEELARRGYRRPGLVLPTDDDERVMHLSVARFLAWQHLESTARPVPPLLAPTLTPETIVRWARRHRPDVVISPRHAVRTALEQGGYSIPDEIGFATNCWLPSHPACSGIDQNPRALGAAAVELLVTQLQRNELGIPVDPQLTLLQGRWIEGATVRPTTGAARPRG